MKKISELIELGLLFRMLHAKYYYLFAHQLIKDADFKRISSSEYTREERRVIAKGYNTKNKQDLGSIISKLVKEQGYTDDR